MKRRVKNKSKVWPLESSGSALENIKGIGASLFLEMTVLAQCAEQRGASFVANVHLESLVPLDQPFNLLQDKASLSCLSYTGANSSLESCPSYNILEHLLPFSRCAGSWQRGI